MGEGESNLMRFGVAMDAELLRRFDERNSSRGYATRSEALRDLVRADLAQQFVAGGGPAAATLTVIYDHHVRELSERLTAMQHELGTHVVSTLHVHLDADHCLEVIVLRGPAEVLQRAADRIIATKGVEHGRLVMTALPEAEHGRHPHGPHTHGTHAHEHDTRDQGHAHGHSHTHEPSATHRAAPSAAAPTLRRPAPRPKR